MYNNFYLLVFAPVFDEKKLEEILSYERHVGFCSIIYKPEYEYDVSLIKQKLDNFSSKYPWKVHRIIVPNFSETECIDIVFDTNAKAANTNYYIAFEDYRLCSLEYLDKIDETIKNSRESAELFGAVSGQDHKNGFSTSFSNYEIYDRNSDNIYVLDKIKNSIRKIYEI